MPVQIPGIVLPTGKDFSGISATQDVASSASTAKPDESAYDRLGNSFSAIATQSPKAFQAYLMSNGAKAIDAGINELRELGLLTNEMEGIFRSTDPNDRKQVWSTLEAMAKVKEADKQNKADMAADEKARDYFRQGMDNTQQQIAQVDADETLSAQEKAMMKNAIRANAYRENRFGAQMDLSGKEKYSEGALAAYRNRFAEEPFDKSAVKSGKEQEVDFRTRKVVFDTIMNGGKNLIPAFKAATTEVNAAFSKHPGIWGVNANSSAFRRAGNILDTLKEEISSTRNRDDIVGILANMASRISGDKTLGLSQQERDDLNVMLSATGNLAADYIMSMSGKAVTDAERQFLMSNLGMQNFASKDAFRRSFNNMLDVITDKMKQAEDSGKAFDQEAYNGIINGFGYVPSEVARSYRINEFASSPQSAAPAAPSKPTTASAPVAPKTRKKIQDWSKFGL